MRLILRLLPVTACLLALSVISLLFPPRQYYPQATLQASAASPRFLALGVPVGDLQRCAESERRLKKMMRSVRAPGERLETACLPSPDPLRAHWLGRAALPFDSLQFADGVVLALGPASGPDSGSASTQSDHPVSGGTRALASAQVASDCDALGQALRRDETPLHCAPGGVARPNLAAVTQTDSPEHRTLQASAGGGLLLLFALLLLLLWPALPGDVPADGRLSGRSGGGAAGLARFRAGGSDSGASGAAAAATAQARKVGIALALGDISLLLLALTIVTWARNFWWSGIEGNPGGLQPALALVHGALSATVVVWLGLQLQHYTRRRPFWDEFSETLRVLVTVFLLACTLIFLARLDAARGTLLLVWSFSLVLVPLGRQMVRALLIAADLWRRPAVIVGVGQNAVDAVAAIRSEANLGYEILGYLPSCLGGETVADGIASTGLPLLPRDPRPDGLVSALLALGQPQVIVAVDSLSSADAVLLVQTLSLRFDDIHVIPTIRGLPLFGTSLSHFFRHEVLFLTVRNMLHRKGLQWLKRGFDLLGSLALLALLCPLFAGLSLMIWRSGGSPFYSHRRIGRNGVPFGCLKFRSMYPNADRLLETLLAQDPAARAEWAQDFKLRKDPRITPVGHFLRRTSLDELPQLWNVLKGEMSLVGPRPIIQAELERYGDQVHQYLQVRPGITGLWQVSGRNDTDYAERVALDTWYVQNWSLWYDIAILFKTINTVLARRGAY